MKKLFAALLGLGLVALLVYAVTRDDKSSPNALESEVPLNTLAPGDEALYSVKIVTTQKSAAQDAVLINLEGTLSQIPQDEGEFVTSWKELTKLSIMNAANDPAASAVLIGKSMVSRLEGREVTHYLPKDFPQGLATFQLGLLQKMFIGVKPEGDRPVSTTEKDEAGIGKIRYAFQRKGDHLEVVRTWIQYVQDYIKVDAVDNHLDYTLGLDGRLIKMNGIVTLHYRKPTASHYSTVISITLKASQAALSSRPRVARETLEKTTLESAAAAVKTHEDLNVMSYEEALQKVDGLTGKSDSKEVYAVFSALKTDVIKNPEHATALIDKILATKERDASARRRLATVFGALAQSESPAISDSLAQLATRCPDNFCKVQAIIGLNDHPNPSNASAEKMLALAASSGDAEISGTALLAAGSIGKKLTEAVPELPKVLIEDLTDPSKAPMKSTVLAAMGNHGSPEYFPALEANTTAKDPSVRAAAVYSMRFLPNAEVNPTLVGVLESEADKDVTRDALKAIQYRNLSEAEYVKVAQKSATFADLDLQQSAARVLLEAYRDNPKNAESSLNALKESTQFPDVKTFIEAEMKGALPSPSGE